MSSAGAASDNFNGITLTGFNDGDGIFAPSGYSFYTSGGAEPSYSGGILTFTLTNTATNANTTYTLNVASTSSSTFTYQTVDGQEVLTQGTYAVCFMTGTMISTPGGEIAVEDIQSGTLVKTTDGRALPVRWVGWTRVSARFADRLQTMPIRIKAGALDENMPARDLLVSPCHAMHVRGILIQAGALVNDVTILREQNVPEQFTYYHVELATHELLLAEGTPAESFVDNVGRMNFHNWNAREMPEIPVPEMDLPRAKSARQVPQAIRQALDVRTALAMPAQAA